MHWFYTVEGYTFRVNKQLDGKLRAFFDALYKIDRLHDFLDRVLYEKILHCPPLSKNYAMNLHRHVHKQLQITQQDLHNKWTDVFDLLFSCFGDYSKEKH